jgi:hypothetical protein
MSRAKLAALAAVLVAAAVAAGVVLSSWPRPAVGDVDKARDCWRLPDKNGLRHCEGTISISTPKPNSILSSPVSVAGGADTFEALLRVDVRRVGGRLLRSETIMASSGSGTPGRWSVSLELPPGRVRLVFYEPSARDGSPTSVVELPLRIRP